MVGWSAKTVDMNIIEGKMKNCDCGCNAPSFTTPRGAIEFLAGRMEFAGIAEGVAQSYARDLRKIIAEYYTPKTPSCACCGTTENLHRDYGSGGPYRCNSGDCIVF